jgi:hypothetical protein
MKRPLIVLIVVVLTMDIANALTEVSKAQTGNRRW